MTKDEALRLALEALESCDAAHITDGGRQWYDEKLVDKAITAIKEALAQPEQEPVAWIDKMVIDVPNQLFYTAPHTWIGLTDAEVKKIVGSDRYTDLLKEVVQIVEAKLRSKNNG